MEITKSAQGKWQVLAIKGELDMQTAPELEAAGLAALESEWLSLDLRELDYISSAGLRILFLLAKKAEELGHELAIFGAADMVKEVLEESGIDMFLTCYDGLEDLP